MNQLSIENINRISPYKVASTPKGSIIFCTEYGIHYVVDFIEDDSLLSYESYEFIIVNADSAKSPRDIKLKETLLAIIEEFFEKNQSTMLYICDTSDGMQRYRNRLFASWFNGTNMSKRYTLCSANIKDLEGTENYASIVVRNDNPNLSLIIKDFEETTLFLATKPN